MSKYYRVNLKDKNGDIIFPNIHNKIYVGDNGNLTLDGGTLTIDGGNIGLSTGYVYLGEGNVKLNNGDIELINGTIVCPSSKYFSATNPGAINLNNSDMSGVNSIYFRDSCNNANEGIHFKRNNENYDRFCLYEGAAYAKYNSSLTDTSQTSDANSVRLLDRRNSIKITGVVETLRADDDPNKKNRIYYKNNGDIDLNVHRRGCIVGQNSDNVTDTNQWYKFASCSVSAAYQDRLITFHVYTGFFDSLQLVGVLSAHFRTNGNNQFHHAFLRWEYAAQGIPVNNFVLTYQQNIAPTVIELWCKCPTAYQGYHFDVISEGSRSSRIASEWVLYDAYDSSQGKAAPTSGMTQLASVTNTLLNTTNRAIGDSDGLQINNHYLKLTGGTMTGNIQYTMNSRTDIPLKVRGGDVNGMGVSLGAGGSTIVGSGESARNMESLVTAGDETLFLTSDGMIKFYTNCQTIDNRKEYRLDGNGWFYPVENNTGSIGTSANKWNTVYATRFYGELGGNILTEDTNPTSGTSYSINFTAGHNNAYFRLRGNDGLRYYTVQGTTSAAGRSELILGNSIAEGTAGNKRGQIRLFSQKNGSIYLMSQTDNTQNYTILLPPANGTACLTTLQHTTNTDGFWYLPSFVNGAAGTIQRTNSGFQTFVKTGTTSAIGRNIIQLGTGTAAGADGNARGEIRLYGQQNFYYDILATGTMTANRTLTLPNASYTLAEGCSRGVKGRSSKGDLGWGTNNNYLPDISMLAYWDGHYSGTSSNLTYCWQGTIQAKPTGLYMNNEGTTGAVTLSKTSANFNYFVIIFGKNNSSLSSITIFAPNGKNAILSQSLRINGPAIQVQTKNIHISGTAITVNSNTMGGVNAYGGTRGVEVFTGNELRIFQVAGFK